MLAFTFLIILLFCVIMGLLFCVFMACRMSGDARGWLGFAAFILFVTSLPLSATIYDQAKAIDKHNEARKN